MPENLATLSSYLGARQMSKREFFAAFFAFLAAMTKPLKIAAKNAKMQQRNHVLTSALHQNKWRM